MAAPGRQLISVAEPRSAGSVRAAVLVLHGGRDRSTEPVRARQLAVLRMVPIARRIAAAGHGGLAVFRLRFGVRGWNGKAMSPVADVTWALEQLAERHPGRPIGLVGHSMGGRTALRAASQDQVRSVVGLAPWLPPGEPIDQLAGCRVLLAHGDRDRMTSAVGTERFAAQLRAAGVPASFVTVRGDGHAMLRRAAVWHELAAGFLVGTLMPDADPSRLDAGQSGHRAAPNYLREVISGAARVTV